MTKQTSKRTGVAAERRRGVLKARLDKAVRGCVDCWEGQVVPGMARMERRVEQMSAAQEGVTIEREETEAARAAAAPALSPQLLRTLESLMKGEDVKEVARRMGLSPHTVHAYVTEIYKRYGVHTRAELLARCLRAGV